MSEKFLVHWVYEIPFQMDDGRFAIEALVENSSEEYKRIMLINHYEAMVDQLVVHFKSSIEPFEISMEDDQNA